MKTFLKIFIGFLIFILLTVFTQVGGIIYLLCLPLFNFIKRKVQKRYKQVLYNIGGFIVVYSLITILLVPVLAKSISGRVPLPVFQKKETHLAPLNLVYPLMNRTYVTPKLKEKLLKVAKQMNTKHKGSVVTYLDANFPFGIPVKIGKFRVGGLLPHLSHHDGKKCDLSLFYTDAKTNKPVNNVSLSFTGYGVYETPKKNEVQPSKTFSANMIGYITFQFRKKWYNYDHKRTKSLIDILMNNKVQRILIEPYLRNRMGYGYNHRGIIGRAGSYAARHDDHIHFQVH